MSSTPQVPGSIGWIDLTIPNAEEVRDFYAAVAGWKPEPVDMGGYADFNMTRPTDGAAAAGVCHARGSNADFPPQWLIYITVEDLEASTAKVQGAGGEIVVEPRALAGGKFCVVRDPAGAVAALYQP